MMADRSSALNALVRKLNSIGHLSGEDRRTLEALPISLKSFNAGHDVSLEGDRPMQCSILLEGWTCRYKTFTEGRRQILALHMPGDLVDLQSLDMPVMDHSVGALTDVSIANIAHATMRDLLAGSTSLRSILWRATLIEAATTRQWLLGVGMRSADERIAHLVCESVMRAEGVGLVQKVGAHSTFAWPMTQILLGQVVGLSPVHVNRTLRHLRDEGMLRLSARRVTILDLPRLQAKAGFDAGYLGLNAESRSAA